MAKKTIISDFSALKGKISFSEKTSDTKISSKETLPAVAEQRQKVGDKGLRVGQGVVLMDSNLRGRIIRLGKTVRIELEDGLIIESAYSEFTVTDKSEIDSLKDTKVKAKKTSIVPKRSAPANPDSSLTINLHIEAIPGSPQPTSRELICELFVSIQ